jgi:hypothetical protein
MCTSMSAYRCCYQCDILVLQLFLIHSFSFISPSKIFSFLVFGKVTDDPCHNVRFLNHIIFVSQHLYFTSHVMSALPCSYSLLLPLQLGIFSRRFYGLFCDSFVVETLCKRHFPIFTLHLASSS